LLAGIHLTVAVPLILMTEARDAQFLRDRAESTAEAQREEAAKALAPASPAPAKEDAEQESVAFTFDPCTMWVNYPPQDYVVQFANLPAFVLTQWRVPCPSRWSLSGMLGAGSTWPQTPLSLVWQKQVDLGLAQLIAIQWFFIGGFPLACPKQWWWEPGAFITLCTVTAFVLLLIPGTGALSRLPMLLAALAWLYWLVLLLWKGLRLAWRLATRRMVHAD